MNYRPKNSSTMGRNFQSCNLGIKAVLSMITIFKQFTSVIVIVNKVGLFACTLMCILSFKPTRKQLTFLSCGRRLTLVKTIF